MNKVCVKCKNEIPEGSDYCPKCGKKVKKAKSNPSTSKKKILPFAIGGGIAAIALIVAIVVFIIIGNTEDKRMIRTLRNHDYTCTKGSARSTLCEKDEDNIKRSFELSGSSITYKELLNNSGTEKVTITISKKLYLRNGSGVAYVSQGGHRINYYPEHCTIDDVPNCPLVYGEKVYPAYKDDYDEYKEYYSLGKDKEYLKALAKGELSQADRIGQKTLYNKYSEIQENDAYTENVNDALRYYERILEEANVSLVEEG